MKLLLIAAALQLSLPLMAEDQVTVQKESGLRVSVANIACVATPTSNNVQLGGISGYGGGFLGDLIILFSETLRPKLNHTVAIGNDCLMAEITEIWNESENTYGFHFDTEITLKTTRGDSFNLADGKCVGGTEEDLKIDLGRGVVLRSVKVAVEDRSDCGNP